MASNDSQPPPPDDEEEERLHSDGQDPIPDTSYDAPTDPMTEQSPGEKRIVTDENNAYNSTDERQTTSSAKAMEGTGRRTSSFGVRLPGQGPLPRPAMARSSRARANIVLCTPHDQEQSAVVDADSSAPSSELFMRSLADQIRIAVNATHFQKCSVEARRRVSSHSLIVRSVIRDAVIKSQISQMKRRAAARARRLRTCAARARRLQNCAAETRMRVSPPISIIMRSPANDQIRTAEKATDSQNRAAAENIESPDCSSSSCEAQTLRPQLRKAKMEQANIERSFQSTANHPQRRQLDYSANQHLNYPANQPLASLPPRDMLNVTPGFHDLAGRQYTRNISLGPLCDAQPTVHDAGSATRSAAKCCPSSSKNRISLTSPASVHRPSSHAEPSSRQAIRVPDCFPYAASKLTSTGHQRLARHYCTHQTRSNSLSGQGSMNGSAKSEDISNVGETPSEHISEALQAPLTHPSPTTVAGESRSTPILEGTSPSSLKERPSPSSSSSADPN